MHPENKLNEINKPANMENRRFFMIHHPVCNRNSYRISCDLLYFFWYPFVIEEPAPSLMLY